MQFSAGCTFDATSISIAVHHNSLELRPGHTHSDIAAPPSCKNANSDMKVLFVLLLSGPTVFVVEIDLMHSRHFDC
jgi:hypothetical protein